MQQDNLEGLRKVKFGKVERYSFGRVKEVLPMPYLLDLQKSSYEKFLDEGIGEALDEFSPIEDYTGKANVEFVDYSIDRNPKLSKQECKRRGSTYSVPLKARVRLIIKDTGEVKEQEVFLGDIPYMTEDGAFVFNGVERVIVSQIIRSPGVYFTGEIDKTGKRLISGTMMPARGTWLEFEQSSADNLKIILDRGSKITVPTFLKCFGYKNDDIKIMFGDNHLIIDSLNKELDKTEDECLIEVAKKMRPNDVPNADATRKYLHDIFFTHQYYNLAKVGRYKFNKKLSLATRITNQISADDIKIDKKVVVTKGEMITSDVAKKIQNAAINEVFVVFNGETLKVIGNNQVDPCEFIGCTKEELNYDGLVYYPNLKELLADKTTKQERIDAFKDKNEYKRLVVTELTIEDIISSISYELNLDSGLGDEDNIDHLSNRRVAPAGELMQNAFRSGVNKLAIMIRETLQSVEIDSATPSSIINARPINKALRDFIASSQLSQLMDEVNPVSGLTQKRKLSSVGPGGIKKDRATAEVRDINYTQYGRICAIETPEGQSIGLINSLTTYAHVNDYGFIETPYKRVDKEKGVVTSEVRYMMADEEENFYIGQCTEPLDEQGHFLNNNIICRYKDTVLLCPKEKVDYLDVASNQFISVATSLIPFIESDESARALMGSNMQRQAVPLIQTESPIIGTGIEHTIAVDSGVMQLCKHDGVVDYVDAMKVVVKTNDGTKDTYNLIKYDKTNQDTCVNQKPDVNDGDIVKVGDVIADGYSTKDGELALGKNMVVAFMNWEGYNYEDAVIISEKLVKKDLFTSITLIVEDMECRTTKLGDEEITRDIPNSSEDSLKNLDENGIIRIGAEVRTNDILVGKVTPKGETELTPEERLLRAIFGEKSREVRDTSLRVQHGHAGVVVDVQIFDRADKKEKYDLPSGVNKMIKVIIAQKRKLSVGDKMSGRHGNKGCVSKVVPEADMPYMSNGQPVDIMLNPLGVPSRMNIGQMLETHLGLVASSLGWKVVTPPFDGAKRSQIQKLLVDNGFSADGKTTLYDGRTGEPFANPITVGVQYMIKLDHMVDSKVHARATGTYALVTQQPLGGKAMFGGQRCGEMEVWALEAYGASHILQEILTIKSDDIVGRNKTYEAIVSGKPIPEPGIPESFKVLVKELQGLGLDITILNQDNKEININHLGIDDDRTSNPEKNEELKDVELDINDNLLNNGDSNQDPNYKTEAEVFDNDSLFDDMDNDE
jgi:DNA-directed RNA polymerase subunit beta